MVPGRPDYARRASPAPVAGEVRRRAPSVRSGLRRAAEDPAQYVLSWLAPGTCLSTEPRLSTEGSSLSGVNLLTRLGRILERPLARSEGETPALAAALSTFSSPSASGELVSTDRLTGALTEPAVDLLSQPTGPATWRAVPAGRRSG